MCMQMYTLNTPHTHPYARTRMHTPVCTHPYARTRMHAPVCTTPVCDCTHASYVCMYFLSFIVDLHLHVSTRIHLSDNRKYSRTSLHYCSQVNISVLGMLISDMLIQETYVYTHAYFHLCIYPRVYAHAYFHLHLMLFGRKRREKENIENIQYGMSRDMFLLYFIRIAGLGVD